MVPFVGGGQRESAPLTAECGLKRESGGLRAEGLIYLARGRRLEGSIEFGANSMLPFRLRIVDCGLVSSAQLFMRTIRTGRALKTTRRVPSAL